MKQMRGSTILTGASAMDKDMEDSKEHDMMKDKMKAMHAPLEEAIELHQRHMDDPGTATMKSQEKLMALLKEQQRMMKDTG